MASRVLRILCMLFLTMSVSANRQHISNNLLFYVLDLTHASAPHIFENYIVFSYEADTYVRSVAISFSEDHYTKRYLYKRISEKSRLFYYAHPVQEYVEELRYRIVVDGVWIADPFNPHSVAEAGGVHVSVVKIPLSAQKDISTVARDGKVHFVLDFSRWEGLAQQRITYGYTLLPPQPLRGAYVAGSFNSWDPFSHRLEKNGHEDTYTLTVPLPPGNYYYYFVVDGQRILDPGNGSTVRESFRKHFVSKIEVPHESSFIR